MISFLAIFAYLPRADYPAIVAPPSVDHEVIVVVYVPKRANPNLAVVTPPVLGFDDGIFEDQGGVPEIDTVLVEISPPLFLVPFEGDAATVHVCVHICQVPWTIYFRITLAGNRLRLGNAPVVAMLRVHLNASPLYNRAAADGGVSTDLETPHRMGTRNGSREHFSAVWGQLI